MATTSITSPAVATVTPRAVRLEGEGGGSSRNSEGQFPDMLGNLDPDAASQCEAKTGLGEKAAPVAGPSLPAMKFVVLPQTDTIEGGTQKVDLAAGEGEIDLTGEAISLLLGEIPASTGEDAPDPAKAAPDAAPPATGPAWSPDGALAALLAPAAPLPPPGRPAVASEGVEGNLRLDPPVNTKPDVAEMPGQVTGLEQAASKVGWTISRRETHFAPLPADLSERRVNTGPMSAAETLSDLMARTPGEAATQLVPQTPNQRRETSISVSLPAARERFAAASVLPVDDAIVTPPVTPKLVQAADADVRPITEAAAVLVAAAKSGDIADGADQPVAQPPAQQVFQRVLSELQGPAQGASGPAPATRTDLAWSPPAQPLKSIELALEPADLGKVTVKLSVRNDVIRIELDVTERQAAGLIEKDKDVLTSLMKSAGYQVDSLAVRHMDGDRPTIVVQQQQSIDPSALGRDNGGSGLMADSGLANGRSGQGQRSFDQQPGGQSAQSPRIVERSSASAAGASRGAGSGIYI